MFLITVQLSPFVWECAIELSTNSLCGSRGNPWAIFGQGPSAGHACRGSALVKAWTVRVGCLCLFGLVGCV